MSAAAPPRTPSNTAVRLLVYGGLPLFALLAYTNVSHILNQNLGVPSILQPLIGLLAIAIVVFWRVFRPDSIALQPMTIGLIAYLLFVFASTAWARDVAVADFTTMELLKSVGFLLVPASLAVSWKALRTALITIVAAAAILSVLALFQVALGDPEFEFGGLAEIEVGHLYGDIDQPRPAGPVNDTNYFARILLLAVPLAAFLGIGSRRRGAKIAYVAAAGVIAVAILFTYSRGAMLALLIVAALLVAAGRIRITPVTAIAALAIVAFLIPTTVARRVATLGPLFGSEETALDHSTDKRRQLIEVGWAIFTDHPIGGVGAGNFGAYYPSYANAVGWSGRDFISEGLRQYPHNTYLELAVETGLVGLLLFLGTMAVAMIALHRSRRTLLERGQTVPAALVTAIAIALLGYLVTSLFLHIGYHRYLWMFIGFAAAAVRLTYDSRFADNR